MTILFFVLLKYTALFYIRAHFEHMQPIFQQMDEHKVQTTEN